MRLQEKSQTNRLEILDFQSEKQRLEDVQYQKLYVMRQAFDDSIFEIQQLTNFLFGEALDDPKVMDEVRSINSQLHKIFLSSDFVCEVNYRKKSDLFK